MAGLEAAHGRLEARHRQVLEHREDPPIDLAGPDVVAARRVDADALVAQHLLLELGLAHHQDLADRDVRVLEDVLALGPVDGRRLEQLPAVEDGLGVDVGRALAGRADHEVHVGGLAGCGTADAAEHGAGDHARALDERPQRGVARVQAEARREQVGVGREAALRGGFVEDLLEAAVVAVRRP